ncbi:MAG: TIGR02281 family clan AA aspartic protease [Sphingobium sp.]|jgi:clan AA aspartic protease (TIGR02281 family)|nr:TIGR02281 family clan AA aspartic protease [Sphingobium sp.]MCI1271004.1 TIGR02281 family clan AA aspartic protease [Sphingobium sp.]MCI1755747.1 TIGR02281 family clan AA aspartic protease [Sphingobium sp.]MCI2053584.1 TIGR02281 family clan AA aspartic protease [Sphingobium sp.]
MLLPFLLQICDAVQPASIFAHGGGTQVASSESLSDRALAVQLSPPAVTVDMTPRRYVVFGPVATPTGNEITRAADGLFYVNAIVNGVVVRFIVDTGATTVVLRAEDARRAGFALDDDSFSSSAQTAGGTVATAHATLPEIIVGNTHTTDIGAAIVRGDLAVSLLGQNWLNRMSSVTISRDRLVIQ